MRRMTLLLTILIGAVFVLTAGCVSREVTRTEVSEPATQREVVVVKEQPPSLPAPRVESPGVAPSPGSTWVPGYWEWNGRDYVWVSGKWVNAQPGSVWVSGHWEQTGSGWQWVPGYWRQ